MLTVRNTFLPFAKFRFGAPEAINLGTGKKSSHCHDAHSQAGNLRGYRYYKCNTQISKGSHLCQSKSIAMQKLDGIVLEALADKVFTPERVKTMLSELKERQQATLGNQDVQLKPLQKELGSIEQESTRLFEAVGKGYLPMDDSLNRHSHKLQARRQEILTAIAGYKRQQEMPLDLLKAKHINAFTKALRIKLLDHNSRFCKEYLRLLVSEIRIEKNEAKITGSYAALANAMSEKNMDTVGRVPRFVPNWPPDLDSNQQSYPIRVVVSAFFCNSYEAGVEGPLAASAFFTERQPPKESLQPYQADGQ